MSTNKVDPHMFQFALNAINYVILIAYLPCYLFMDLNDVNRDTFY